mmetsp:Transcript_12755/g.53640  ORF Transcript_12755/g.53640 Transcript_12755/m.53640 type:complete len:250 (-) Transcript_12755:193-942(-)
MRSLRTAVVLMASTPRDLSSLVHASTLRSSWSRLCSKAARSSTGIVSKPVKPQRCSLRGRLESRTSPCSRTCTMSAGLNPTLVSSRRARRLSAKVGLLTPSLLYDLRAQLLALPHTDEVASVPLSFQTRLAGYLMKQSLNMHALWSRTLELYTFTTFAPRLTKSPIKSRLEPHFLHVSHPHVSSFVTTHRPAAVSSSSMRAIPAGNASSIGRPLATSAWTHLFFQGLNASKSTQPGVRPCASIRRHVTD